MVATELLKLAMETEEGRKERLKKMVDNHSFNNDIILNINRYYWSQNLKNIISTHWRSVLLLCCFHQLLEHSVKFTPLK